MRVNAVNLIIDANVELTRWPREQGSRGGQPGAGRGQAARLRTGGGRSRVSERILFKVRRRRSSHAWLTRTQPGSPVLASGGMPPRASAALCERYAVADVDSHIIEPADLWTSRVSSKWGNLVPHVRFHERRQEDIWYIGDRKLYGVGAFAQAGWPEFPPSHPRRLSEAIPAALDPKERLAYMDQVGVYYQVMYPNILGFHSHVFLNEMPRELATECVRAYNDWLTEFCSADFHVGFLSSPMSSRAPSTSGPSAGSPTR